MTYIPKRIAIHDSELSYPLALLVGGDAPTSGYSLVTALASQRAWVDFSPSRPDLPQAIAGWLEAS
ncbi:MAG: hypothetical protein AAGD25_13010 [Cyanobacteria bacterium P01_F01_bin.150]